MESPKCDNENPELDGIENTCGGLGNYRSSEVLESYFNFFQVPEDLRGQVMKAMSAGCYQLDVYVGQTGTEIRSNDPDTSNPDRIRRSYGARMMKMVCRAATSQHCPHAQLINLLAEHIQTTEPIEEE
jgi:hypothetical protein